MNLKLLFKNAYKKLYANTIGLTWHSETQMVTPFLFDIFYLTFSYLTGKSMDTEISFPRHTSYKISLSLSLAYMKHMIWRE